jgi:hypothetical protein
VAFDFSNLAKGDCTMGREPQGVTKPEQPPQPPAPKQPYQTPRLTDLGPVEARTQGPECNVGSCTPIM